MARTPLLGLVPFLALVGCAPFPHCERPDGHGAAGSPDHSQKEGPKTLLKWAAGGEDEKKDNGDEKNGDKNGEAEGKEGGDNGAGKDRQAEAESDEPKPIETDRPDFTEASSTVGKGRVQLEAGYTFIRDRDGGSRLSSHSFPEALFRIGLFADWFELRIGQNFNDTRTTSGQAVVVAPVAGTEFLNGAEDLYLGVKLALTEQKKYLPETALILQTTVPTGADELSADELLPGINFLFGWDVIEDCLSAGGSLQANRNVDDSDHFYVEVAQSLAVGYELSRRLGAYTEWFAFFPAGAIDPGTGPEHYFDGGFTYLVNDDFQLDIRAGVGLNDHADDFFAGAGFAVRF
jgi:Putative MetA-pathway of phenol degradation